MATALGAGLAGTATLQAATITVTSTADAAPAVDGLITLREAIESANGDAPVNADVPGGGFVAAGADTIQFSAAILPGTINLYDQFTVGSGALTIQGPADRAQLTLDAQDSNRHFYIYSSAGAVSISGLILTDGNASASDGGSISADAVDLTLTNVAITSSVATYDGGAVNLDEGTLVIHDSLLGDNNAGSDGGAVYGDELDVDIQRSTFYSNDAGSDGGAVYLYDAGGMIINSTFSANTAGGDGGAIFFYDSDGVVISHSTIVGNSADDDGGGIYLYDGAVVIHHSIVANNLAGGGDEDLDEDSGAFYVSYSFIEFYQSGVVDLGGNVFGTDPDLAALADNGGLTETHKPNPTSPVIGAGDPAISGEPATDQRGFARVVGTIDVGAVEINAGSFELSAAPNPVQEGGGPVVFTVSRIGGQDGAVSVDLDFSDGSATNPADYVAADTVVSWNDNEGSPSTLKTVNATIVDDPEVEPDETFSGALGNPQGGATLGAVISAEVTIQDNDVEAVAVVEIPALGAVGRALLAGAAAAAAMLRLRRKKDE